MRTPSLARRVVATGVGVVAVLGLGLDVLLYLSVRSVASDRRDAAFDSQTSLVLAVAKSQATPASPDVLADRLGGLGVDAAVRAGRGPVFRSAGARPEGSTAVDSRVVIAGPGLEVTIFAPSPDADPRLRRLLGFEVVITPLAVVLAALLLRWIAEVAMTPLEEIAAAAERTTGGRSGERLRPDRPDTRLGQIATTYDAMLDALEGAVAEARAASLESTRLGERTRRVLETAGEAFMVADAAGAVVEWNAEAERLLGWRREDALGRDLEATVLAPEQAPAHLTSLAHFPEPTDESPYRAKGLGIVATRRDGERFPAEVTVWVTSDDGVHYNALLRDLTQQKTAAEATARLATMVEAIDRAILSTDLDGTVLTWNTGAERMYGFAAAEAVGRSLTSLTVPEAERPRLVEFLAAAARGEVVDHVEVVRHRRDGTPVDVALTISPLRDATGAVYGASSLEKDETEERWTAAQLAASSAALRTALDEARRSEANTRRFLDDAAHQLRTPITSIRASAETLLRNITPEQRDRLLAAVVRDSERAGRLMGGLLRLARLRHADQPPVQVTDLVALCEEEADQARPDSPDIAITVRAGSGPPLGHPVLAADAVAEIVANLVDNARRHARSSIEIVVGRDGDTVCIRVVDDGPGLAADQVDVVFDRFVSLDGQGGSGLGLAIARELARAGGGDLTYEGGAFVVSLPWRPGEPGAPPPAGSRGAPEGDGTVPEGSRAGIAGRA